MKLSKLAEWSQQLIIFRDVFNDPIGGAFIKLINEATSTEINKRALATAYAELFGRLVEETENSRQVIGGDAWKNHLLDRILDSRNTFSLKPSANPHQFTRSAVIYDLEKLRGIYNFDYSTLTAIVRDLLKEPGLPGWDQLADTAFNPDEVTTTRQSIKQKFDTTKDWSILIADLAGFYAEYGVDELSRNFAFRWQRNLTRFEPVPVIDPIRLEDLVGYEREREVIIRNTEQFLAGLPANNVLLYGARGTGKSSTVKGLLNRYGKTGLRLVEVHKEWLSDYPLITRIVRGRKEKFILFVDDLSFEEDEVSYKDLKALLEGSIEARPDNLLIYATSNRRHLIKEQFGDNPGAGDQGEIAAWDTVEEKLSLSDRFGLLVTFISPSQRQYLDIVYALAERNGIQKDNEKLKRLAIQWEISHSGRNGRVARQFIDHLTGLEALQKKEG